MVNGTHWQREDLYAVNEQTCPDSTLAQGDGRRDGCPLWFFRWRWLRCDSWACRLRQPQSSRSDAQGGAQVQEGTCSTHAKSYYQVANGWLPNQGLQQVWELSRHGDDNAWRRSTSLLMITPVPALHYSRMCEHDLVRRRFAHLEGCPPLDCTPQKRRPHCQYTTRWPWAFQWGAPCRPPETAMTSPLAAQGTSPVGPRSRCWHALWPSLWAMEGCPLAQQGSPAQHSPLVGLPPRLWGLLCCRPHCTWQGMPPDRCSQRQTLPADEGSICECLILIGSY